MGVSIALRTYFSLIHIQSAALFARHAAEVEKTYGGHGNDVLLAKQHAYAVGAVFAAVSFLEALINELFADAGEKYQNHLDGLDEPTIEIMADMWAHSIPRTTRYSILEKYDIALVLAGRPPFDSGRQPYQDVDLLVKLRNDLVHYEPEWRHGDYDPSHKPDREPKFVKGLRGKFPPNPIAAVGNPFYPDRCLGHGCAKWAVESSVQFTDDFFAVLGVKPTYEHIRDRLSCD